MGKSINDAKKGQLTFIVINVQYILVHYGYSNSKHIQASLFLEFKRKIKLGDQLI